jgi:TRAP-type C4-dicarboxylate transport system permease small subunit
MNRLNRVSNIVEAITKLLLVVVFTIMIAACVLQVYTRFVLNTSLSWTEELARFTFIWTNLLGATLCVKYNSHATVTVILDILPAKPKKILLIVIQLIILAVSYVLVVPGIRFTLQVVKTLSPAMKWSMSLIYGAVPITGTIIIMYTLINLINMLCDKSSWGAKNQ